MDKKNSNVDNYIEKDATNIIKGVSLIFMFIHHFFTFPSWYVGGISYPDLRKFAEVYNLPLKICVSIFAFLTGYFYYYNKQKNFKYSLKKSTDVWITYVIVFLLMITPMMVFKMDIVYYNKDFILELFAIKRPIMIFCWYVVFYIVVMMILPLFNKWFKKAPILSFCISIIMPVFIHYIGKEFVFEKSVDFYRILRYFQWFPCVISGLIFAKYNLFYELSKSIRTKRKVVNIIIALIIIYISSMTRYFTESYDFVCAPLFILGVMEIYHNIKNKKFFFPISIIGKYSLFMWFIHCAFFNQYNIYTQRILYYPKTPILVLIWGLIICLTLAIIIKIPVDFIIKRKNKILKLD